MIIVKNGVAAEYPDDYQLNPTPTLQELKTAKATSIDADFRTACDAIRAGYSPDEIQSWPQQQAQAEAYTADNTASVPLISAMASARGITVAELAARILANTSAYSTVYGQALGIKQARQDALAAIDLALPDAAQLIESV